MKEKLQLNIKAYIKGMMLIGILVGFASCQDKDEFTPDPITGDASEFYADAQGTYGGDSFNAANDHIYITANNTSVHIPANSLVYADGSDATGEVSVILEDVLNKGELVVHNVPMLTSDKVLSSEGALFVAFSQNGVELFIKPGSLVIVRLRDPSADVNAQLYDGLDMVDDTNWEVSNQPMSLESWTFFWDGKDWPDTGYEFYITETGWYSVALELNPTMSSVEPICVSLPSEVFDGTNSDVFLVLDDYDTVVPLEMDSEKMLFCATFSNIPQGAEAKIVSISSLGEQNYHFGTSSAIINVDNEDVLVFPTSKTKEEILDALAAL